MCKYEPRTTTLKTVIIVMLLDYDCDAEGNKNRDLMIITIFIMTNRVEPYGRFSIQESDAQHTKDSQ